MRLWISDNELTSIDVSRLKNLESLVLSNNQLTSIDVSGLENLTGLFLGNNQLTSIDVSGLEKLVRLNLDNNQLTSIDISGLENLTELTLWYNFINSQDDVIGLDPNNLNTIGALLFQRLMSHVGFSLSQYLYTYDGSPKIPVVSVSFGLIELEEGTDFSLRYEDNINAGTARIILTGMNNFRGERVIEFTIRKVQKEWIPVPAITKEFSEGLTLGDIELPESYSWKHPEWLLWIFSEAIEFEAVLASNNVNHYDAIGKISVTITEQGVSIANMNRNDSRYGIRFTQNPVSDKAEISVILPNNEASTGSATEIVIFDMTGNVVFNRRGDPCGRPIIWDLRNTSGRFVANGTYLVIAEVKDRSGNTHRYSARLGVKR